MMKGVATIIPEPFRSVIVSCASCGDKPFDEIGLDAAINAANEAHPELFLSEQDRKASKDAEENERRIKAREEHEKP